MASDEQAVNENIRAFQAGMIDGLCGNIERKNKMILELINALKASSGPIKSVGVQDLIKKAEAEVLHDQPRH